MKVIKFFLKLIALPIIAVIWLACFLAKAATHISCYVFGPFMLLIGIILLVFLFQKNWTSVGVCGAVELACLVVLAALVGRPVVSMGVGSAAAMAVEVSEPTGTPLTEIPTPEPDRSFHMEVIRQTPEPQAQQKRILIYHSHTYEAYCQVPDAPYVETEKWRTRDETANVVAVGKALAASLTALGFEVVHDTTAFEPPELSSSYTRSLAMLEDRRRSGEDYDLYIDLHREAIAATSTIRRTVQIGGQEVARFMVLIGKGTSGGYDVKPDWEANYAIALRITDSLNHQHEELCREVKLKSGRFNQHIAPHAVLIECGNNYNTLEQVLRGVPYLAQAIADALNQQID